MTLSINKYHCNQLLFVANIAVVTILFYIILSAQINLISGTILFFLIALCQHYFLNLVHIGSHHLLSRNPLVNSFIGNICAIMGGVTFADFKTTHFLHHRNVSDDKHDPDHWITTSGSVFTIPFKIFYHDYYFWSQGLWKKQHNWRGYIINRVAQIILVTGFQFTGNIQIWQNFWLLPLLVVGFLNGLFLFYFPHYSTKIERRWRKQNTPNPLKKLSLLAIDISRIYHEKHHDRIAENSNYFPVLSFIKDKFQGVWSSYCLAPMSKYTDIKIKRTVA
jgi:fatty acid desaturase